MPRTLPGAQVNGHHSARTGPVARRRRVIRTGWDRLTRSSPSMAGYLQTAHQGGVTMTLLVTRPRRSLAMYPVPGMPVTSGAPVDVEETAEAFRVELDLPGVGPGDVQIELRDSEIRVAGTFGERRRAGTLRHQGRPTGEFEYVVALPGDVEADAVTADLDAGVLAIVAPKASGRQARRIAVHRRPPGAVEGAVVPDERSARWLRSPDDPQTGPGSPAAARPGSPAAARPDEPAAAAKGPDDPAAAAKGPDNPAAAAKQMKEGQPRSGPAGPSGTGSTGQVARSSLG
jgi:HSP20 family molecular chaperone IbpA